MRKSRRKSGIFLTAIPSLVQEDSYDRGWLFRIKPDEDASQVLKLFAAVREYAETLKGSDGHKNPGGIKGGISGICKAVYTGIREQKF